MLLGLFASACTPQVELAVPNEPININLNVKIEHEIYIRVDKARLDHQPRQRTVLGTTMKAYLKLTSLLLALLLALPAAG